MTDTVAALYRFFSGFGIHAHAEGDVPKDETPPYITVQLIEPTWDVQAPFYARLWYRGASYAPIMAKADEISRAIGTGVCLRMDDGALWIHKGDTFVQRMTTDGDPALKCLYLSMQLQAIKGE